MLISEIFLSVQGEGRLAGTPSLFIRTGRCPLRCTWCDTPYASWKTGGSKFSVEQIMAFVRAAPPLRHVVVTGGEPLLETDLPDLTRRLRKLGRHVTLETSGFIYRRLEGDLVSLSPKLGNSIPWRRANGRFAARHRDLCLNPAALRTWLGRHDCQIKFVVEADQDLAEIRTCLKAVGPVEKSRVYLMPQARTRAALKKTGPLVVRWCGRTGFSYSPRLQLEWFSTRRGC